MSEASHIESFLQVLEDRAPDDWWSKYDEHGYWLVKYKGYAPPCQFHIELDAVMMYLYATLSIDIWYECRFALYRYALRLNEELSNAKFGIDPAGQLSLMVEWPRSDLNYVSFETAVQTLLNYHQAYYSDLELVAQDPDLAQQVLVHELQEQAEQKAVQVRIGKTA